MFFTAAQIADKVLFRGFKGAKPNYCNRKKLQALRPCGNKKLCIPCLFAGRKQKLPIEKAARQSIFRRSAGSLPPYAFYGGVLID
jgi:hypothetical protein